MPYIKEVRPTTSRTLEALFATIEVKLLIEQSDCLDLFCGTGKISLALWQKKAKHICSVDINMAPLKKLQQEVFKKNRPENWSMVQSSVWSFIQESQSQYDFIFADPPYELPGIQSLIEPCIKLLRNKNSMFVLEHKNNLITNSPFLVEKRNYGLSSLSFFKKI